MTTPADRSRTLVLTLIGAIVALTAVLGYFTAKLGDEPAFIEPSPSTASRSSEASAPDASSQLETTQQAFARAMSNCSIGQGDGAALTLPDSTADAPAALVMSPELTEDGVDCLTFQLGMPSTLSAELLGPGAQPTGRSGWTTGYSGAMEMTWERSPAGLVVVITGHTSTAL